jgi:hypothetical protein
MPHNADGIRTCRRVNGDGSRHINNKPNVSVATTNEMQRRKVASPMKQT